MTYQYVQPNTFVPGFSSQAYLPPIAKFTPHKAPHFSHPNDYTITSQPYPYNPRFISSVGHRPSMASARPLPPHTKFTSHVTPKYTYPNGSGAAAAAQHISGSSRPMVFSQDYDEKFAKWHAGGWEGYKAAVERIGKTPEQLKAEADEVIRLQEEKAAEVAKAAAEQVAAEQERLLEKERAKQAEKDKRKEERAKAKEREEERKAIEKAKAQAKKEKERLKEEERKAKEKERKEREKDKERERKEKEKERREIEKAKKEAKKLLVVPLVADVVAAAPSGAAVVAERESPKPAKKKEEKSKDKKSGGKTKLKIKEEASSTKKKDKGKSKVLFVVDPPDSGASVVDVGSPVNDADDAGAVTAAPPEFTTQTEAPDEANKITKVVQIEEVVSTDAPSRGDSAAQVPSTEISEAPPASTSVKESHTTTVQETDVDTSAKEAAKIKTTVEEDEIVAETNAPATTAAATPKRVRIQDELFGSDDDSDLDKSVKGKRVAFVGDLADAGKKDKKKSK